MSRGQVGEERRYRIGTVARLTGLSPDTVRAWERRHRIVVPARSGGGTRLYSERDVARLQLLKALIDTGEAIGVIAGLSDASLRERLGRSVAAVQLRATVGARPAGPLRVALLDPTLAAELRTAGDALGLEIALAAEDLGGLQEALHRLRPDVVVIALAALGDAPVSQLEGCIAQARELPVFVLYDFAPRRRLARLAEFGAELVRRPVDLVSLRGLIAARVGAGAPRPRAAEPLPTPPDLGVLPPERCFDAAQTARLRELRSSIVCECPRHLAAIIESLTAFERYCEACRLENPEDAEVHAMLGRGTGHARSLVEQLLTVLCEHEGIRL